jgi:SAM-dependent methyltransferase
VSVDDAAVGGGVIPEQGAELTEAAAQAWTDRWDRQQEGFMPDREERFTALIDAVAEAAGRPDPLVLDLGCGPGSLAVRLLDRIPAATVIAIDADPVLLALGRAAYAGRGGLRFVDRDLGTPGWTAGLGADAGLDPETGPGASDAELGAGAGRGGLGRLVDAAVSTTALHWLSEERLRGMYAELAGVLRPGGVLLNGDHLEEDETVAPVLARLGDALVKREQERRPPSQQPESWPGWWEAVLADPALAGAAAERASRWGGADHHGSEARWLRVHVAALRDAGFAETGTLWQRGASRVLCGVAGTRSAG